MGCFSSKIENDSEHDPLLPEGSATSHVGFTSSSPVESNAVKEQALLRQLVTNTAENLIDISQIRITESDENSNINQKFKLVQYPILSKSQKQFQSSINSSNLNEILTFNLSESEISFIDNCLKSCKQSLSSFHLIDHGAVVVKLD